MKPYLYLLFFILILSCNGKEESEPRAQDISSIAGVYAGTLQHDVIKNNSGMFEEYDTTYFVDGFQTIVTYDNQEVALQFPNTGKYILPELKYKVKRIEESIYGFIDVQMELLTTNEYRMKASPNQFLDPAFRIWLGAPSINRPEEIVMSIFLRSQDSDSVYNIIVEGRKK